MISFGERCYSNQCDEISDDEFSDDEISGFANTTKFLTTKFLATKFPPPRYLRDYFLKKFFCICHTAHALKQHFIHSAQGGEMTLHMIVVIVQYYHLNQPSISSVELIKGILWKHKSNNKNEPVFDVIILHSSRTA